MAAGNMLSKRGSKSWCAVTYCASPGRINCTLLASADQSASASFGGWRVGVGVGIVVLGPFWQAARVVGRTVRVPQSVRNVRRLMFVDVGWFVTECLSLFHVILGRSPKRAVCFP